MKEKVVLAYSGGLDTTALIPWLKETFDYDVVCCCVNCGQGNELDGLDERAKLSGASKLYIEDIVDEFCDDFIVPLISVSLSAYHITKCFQAQHNIRIFAELSPPKLLFICCYPQIPLICSSRWSKI